MKLFFFILLCLAATVSCNEKKNKPVVEDTRDCSLDSTYHYPLITDVDLNKYTFIHFKQYKKGDGFKTLIKDTTEFILERGKSYYEQGNNWTFHIDYQINTNSDYKVYFIGPGRDTVKFTLTGMEMKKIKHYIGSSCGLVSYVVNDDTITNVSNIPFMKNGY